MALNIAVRYYNMLVQWKPTRCTISQLYFDKQLVILRNRTRTAFRDLRVIHAKCHILDKQAEV